MPDGLSLGCADAQAPPPSRTSTLGANKNKTSAAPAPTALSKGSAPPMIPRKSETMQVALSKRSLSSGAKAYAVPAIATPSSCGALSSERRKVALLRILF